MGKIADRYHLDDHFFAWAKSFVGWFVMWTDAILNSHLFWALVGFCVALWVVRYFPDAKVLKQHNQQDYASSTMNKPVEYDQNTVSVSDNLLGYVMKAEELISKKVLKDEDLVLMNNSFLDLSGYIIEFVKTHISLQRAYNLTHPGLSVVMQDPSAYNQQHNTLLHDMRVFRTSLATIQRSQADLEAALRRGKS